MKMSRRIYALVLAAFALLGLAEVTHIAQHLDLLPAPTHSHIGARQDHDHDSKPTSSGDAPDHVHLSEHNHSPAIVEKHYFFGHVSVALSQPIAVLSIPESPVLEIEYPPQLS